MTELASGEIVKLQVKSQEGSKWILQHNAMEIPLNASEAPEDLQVDDTIEVFLFVDRRGNLSATTGLPTIQKGTYGWARVIKVSEKEGALCRYRYVQRSSSKSRGFTEDKGTLASKWRPSIYDPSNR